MYETFHQHLSFETIGIITQRPEGQPNGSMLKSLVCFEGLVALQVLEHTGINEDSN